MTAEKHDKLDPYRSVTKGMTRLQERQFFIATIDRLKAEASDREGQSLVVSVPPTVEPPRGRPAPNFDGIATSDLIDHTPSEAELKAIYGTKTVGAARGIYISALLGLGEAGDVFRTLAVSMGAEMNPRDVLEAMLLTQMANTHAALARASRKAADGKTLAEIEGFDRIANRLGRTFTTQMEALRKYQSGSEQRVHVDNVTVNDGGRAIVGNVRGERGSSNEI